MDSDTFPDPSFIPLSPESPYPPRLIKELRDVHDLYGNAWSKLVEAAEGLKALEPSLTHARNEARILEARIKAHDQTFGFDAEAPPTWSPAAQEAKFVYLVDLMLSELAFAEPSGTIMGDLTNPALFGSRVKNPESAQTCRVGAFLPQTPVSSSGPRFG